MKTCSHKNCDTDVCSSITPKSFLLITPQISLVYLCKHSSFPTSYMTITNLFFVSSFIFFRVSYKQNHTVCSLLWLVSFVSLTLLNFIPIVFCITSLFILLKSSIPLNEYTAICLSIQHLVDICIVSSFCYCEKNCYELLSMRLCTNVYFHFFSVNIWVIW